MGRPEQICRKHCNLSRSFLRFIKRYTAKVRRRAGKQLLEDAPPPNRYSGWTD